MARKEEREEKRGERRVTRGKRKEERGPQIGERREEREREGTWSEMGERIRIERG